MQTYIRICLLIVLYLFNSEDSKAQAPVANFTVSKDSSCAPTPVTFVSTSTGSPTSFLWEFGNTFTSANPHTATHTYTTPGTYIVKLTVSNASGSSSKTFNLTVLPTPTVNFTASPLSGCPPLTVNFTNTTVLNVPGAGTYNWNFGTGIPSTTQNPSHTFYQSGLYNVVLGAKNSAGCSNSIIKQQYINVFTPPQADFSYTPICTAPGSTTFTATVTGTGPYTYSWDYGDLTPSGSGATTSHVYTTGGNYTATLFVTDANGCKDTVVKTVNVGTLKASFNPPPSVICAGNPVHFVNSSTAATYYTWYFGDGNTSSGINPTNAYSNPGTYKVTLYAKDVSQTCIDSFSRTITVSAGPIVDFSISPVIPCPADDTLFFTNLSVGAVSYEWTFGDGSPINTQTNPYHIYNFDSVYIIKLKATDANGCSSTISKRDTFFKMEIDVIAGEYNHCVPSTIKFSIDSLYTYWTWDVPDPWKGWQYILPNPPFPIPFTSVSWNFGDNSPSVSSTRTPSHTYTNAGTYYVTATVTTLNGCVLIDSFPVHLDTLPNANFALSHDTICVSDTLHITDLSTGANYSTYHIVPDYTTADASTSPPLFRHGTYVFKQPGTTIVTMKAFNNTCHDSAQLPVVAIGPAVWPLWKVSCDTPGLVHFKDTTRERISWRLWEFGDGATDTAKNPTHFYSTFGQYTARLTVHDDSTGCTNKMEIPLHIYVPTANFWGHDTAICKTDTVHLSQVFSDPIADYFYTVNTTNIVIRNYPPPDKWMVFPTADRYTLTLNFRDNNGCLHDTTKTNYILVADPNPNFRAVPHIGCAPLSTILIENGSNTPGAYTTNWRWSFGDNTTANVANDSVGHIYNAGKYDVKVVLTDNVGCKDSVIVLNTVEARNTVAGFYANDTTACIGDTIKFTNTSTTATNVALTYKWNFGDGSPIDTSKNPSHVYTQTGAYTVSLISVDNIGCIDTLIRPSYIKLTKPNAFFTMDDTFALCPPLIVNFGNGTTGAISYDWVFGDGSTSKVMNATNIYVNPGKYDITLVATDSYGCTDTAYSSAEVLGYAGAITYNTTSGCNPLTVNFIANLTNVSNFLWDFSDGNVVPATGNTTTHTYTTPGKFLPKIIFTDSAGCVNSSSGIDTIYVDDVIANFTSTAACINTPVIIKDTSFSFFSRLDMWSWDVNNGQVIGNQNSVTTTFPAVGNYPVVLIVKNSNGCWDTLRKNITINPLPTITTSKDTTICIGDMATISAFGGVSYEWFPANGNLGCPTCQTTTAKPNGTTNYIVTGTDAHGCKNKDTVKVTTQTKTTSLAGPGGEICIDSSIQLTVSGAQRYLWTPATGLDNPNISNPIASPKATTTYTVIAYEGSCVPDSNKVRVVVHPLPTVRAIGDETIVVGNSVNLHAEGTNISKYIWTPSQTLSCSDCSSPISTPTATTTYVVTVTSDFGCRAADSVTITVLCDQSQLFIPNTFSPNGDGENDVFYPRGLGLQSIRSFRIYNRWGEMVYERQGIQLNDAASAWDGTYKGNMQNPDVFVYVLEGVCDGGELMVWKGDISLIR